mmetsp:Transcript_98808/g.195925  ORF Transcript_98808/g.195925 Transcript_98808/m.195925 type:complete len:172 (-) Transcript_98808:53-568(-)
MALGPATRVRALSDASENLFEATYMSSKASDAEMAALSLDANNDQMQSILLSLLDTFDCGESAHASPIRHGKFCHDNLGSWHSKKLNGNSLSSIKTPGNGLEPAMGHLRDHALQTPVSGDPGSEHTAPVPESRPKEAKPTSGAKDAPGMQLLQDSCPCLAKKPRRQRLVCL